MSTIVIMPGGFHPFHAGHFALYQSAKKAFPGADLYVAATNDMSERPFPFQLKEKLAKLAGVDKGHFVQVKNPFQSKEITQNYDPDQDVLVFVRSEKDRNEQPKPGGTKKDGSPAYFQPWTGKNVQPFGKHAYMAYLPTVEFGPGITSATQIRKAWPTLNDKRKLAMVMSLYPAAQKNSKLAQNVVGMFDQVMGGQLNEFAPTDDGEDRDHEYEVYQCNPDDQFDWIGGPIYKTDDMGKAHGIAYNLHKKYPNNAFMIWQERSQGSRGGYGIKDDEQDVAEEQKSINEGLLDYTNRQRIIQYLAHKLDWEVSYLQLASDHNLISWYKAVRAGKKPMGESALKDKQDLDAKRKALQDMEREPGHDKDAIRQRKLDLEKEARAKNLSEDYIDEK